MWRAKGQGCAEGAEQPPWAGPPPDPRVVSVWSRGNEARPVVRPLRPGAALPDTRCDPEEGSLPLAPVASRQLRVRLGDI